MSQMIILTFVVVDSFHDREDVTPQRLIVVKQIPRSHSYAIEDSFANRSVLP